MDFVQDGADVYCLPDNAYCNADEEKRSPLDIDDCPVGCEVCSGDCYYYREDDEKFKPGGDGIDFKVIGSIFDGQEEGREMTENDAKEYLEDMLTEGQCIGDEIVARDDEEAIRLAISALEEIQQYRAIGTVEECREARERQRAKKPVLNENSNVMFCPVCERKVRRNYDLHCSGCGQAIDWSDTDGIT